MKICILSDKIDKYIEQNFELIETIIDKYGDCYLLSINEVKPSKKIKNLRVIKSSFDLFKILNKDRYVCIYGLTEKYYDWKWLFMINISRTKLVRIANISTLFQGQNSNKNLLKRYFFKLSFLLYLFLLTLKVLKRADIFFTSKQTKHWSNFLLFKEIVPINSRHYDEIQNINSNRSNQYIVFIDSNIHDHEDILTYGGKNPINPRKYFSNLNTLLTNIGKCFKKDVIFCAHPRTDLSILRECVPDIKISTGKTAEYSSNSFLTLFHDSSAINYSIILMKRIILIKSKFFDDNVAKVQNQYISDLNLNYYILEEKNFDCNFFSNVNVDKLKYNNFINQKLCTSDNIVDSKSQIVEKLSQLNE